MSELQIPNVLRSVCDRPTPVKIAIAMRSFCAQPWAVRDEWLADMLAGAPLAPPSPDARDGDGFDGGSPKGIAVIPIRQVITQDPVYDWVGNCSASTTKLSAALDAAIAIPDVAGVLLNINSPGGSVYGVSELAEKIRGMRQAAGGAKPIWAIANSIAASAAYWIGSQVDRFVVTPGGEVGSIGVRMVHWDESKMLENFGVAPTILQAGKYKTEGHSFGPLGDDARSHLQSRIDTYYDMFVNAVAKGRGVKASVVRGGFGEGRMVLAATAAQEGMVDGVATFDETVQRFLKAVGKRGGGGGAKASAVMVMAEAERENRERMLKLRGRAVG